MSAALAALREHLRDPGVEATAFPFFVIAEETKRHKIVLLAGVWFSREAAEEALDASRHNFPDAFVYCASGHLSDDWRDLLENGVEHEVAQQLVDDVFNNERGERRGGAS